jgi:hypothetical protein
LRTQWNSHYPHQKDLHNHKDYEGLFGGGGEIRTPGELAPTSVFKTDALNHYATPPWGNIFGAAGGSGYARFRVYVIKVATSITLSSSANSPCGSNPARIDQKYANHLVVIAKLLVHPERLELPALCSEDRCSNPLSYGCITRRYYTCYTMKNKDWLLREQYHCSFSAISLQ